MFKDESSYLVYQITFHSHNHHSQPLEVEIKKKIKKFKWLIRSEDWAYQLVKTKEEEEKEDPLFQANSLPTYSSQKGTENSGRLNV